jgi:hypothetical protein
MLWLMNSLVFAYLVEWVFGDVPESSKETLYKEIIRRILPDI